MSQEQAQAENQILALKSGNNWFEEMDEIRRTAKDHFQKIYSKSVIDCPTDEYPFQNLKFSISNQRNGAKKVKKHQKGKERNRNEVTIKTQLISLGVFVKIRNEKF